MCHVIEIGLAKSLSRIVGVGSFSHRLGICPKPVACGVSQASQRVWSIRWSGRMQTTQSGSTNELCIQFTSNGLL